MVISVSHPQGSIEPHSSPAGRLSKRRRWAGSIAGILVLAGLLLGLSSCANIKVSDYAEVGPPLVLEDFFTGKLTAHGVVKDRKGKVIRHFNATIDASWKDGIGTLDERFVFSDGERQTRVWRLEPTGDGRYRGSAADVIGDGDLRIAGNALFLNYVLRTPYKDGTIDLRVDDRMYKVDESTIINESTLYKFGFRVGEIVLTLKRV